VAARVTYTGTHQGEFVGIPATGKQTTTTNGVDFFRMQDGRQAEHWGGGTCSAPWRSWASCPPRVRRDQAHPPRSGRQQVTAVRPGLGRYLTGETSAVLQRYPAAKRQYATAGKGLFCERSAQATYMRNCR
jgi:hypothetical protein